MIWFDEANVVRYAGGDGCDRALPYVDAIDVTRDLEVSSDEVVATVGIDEEFRVRLTGSDGRLIGECSCSEGRRGVFCVHCVAAAVIAADVPTPPDVKALLSQVDALGEPRRLVGPSLLSWAEEANFVLYALELGTVCYPEITRPLYQQLLWHVAHKTHWFENRGGLSGTHGGQDAGPGRPRRGLPGRAAGPRLIGPVAGRPPRRSGR